MMSHQYPGRNGSGQPIRGWQRKDPLACLFGWSVLLATVISNGCCTEPVWRGRSLSAWLGDLNSLESSRSELAEIAVKQIGSNAVPVLLKRLAAKPPVYGDAIAEKQSEAVLAFRVLGNSARQALPVLSVLLTNCTGINRLAVAQSMAGIGEEAKPRLSAALSHPNPIVRRASLVGLIDLGTAARDAVPAVMGRLNDSDAEVKSLALFFIGEVCDEPEVKLRVFKEAAQDPDRHVRFFAERELRRMGWSGSK